MIMKNSYGEDILSYVKSLPDSLLHRRGMSKEALLADNSVVDRLWTCYQKDVEEYDCDEGWALADAVFEVLGITHEVQEAALAGGCEVFEYEGLHFMPAFCISENWDLKEYCRHIRSDISLGVSKYDWGKKMWDYNIFYEAAGSRLYDVFKCVENSMLYIPGENELFQYMN